MPGSDRTERKLKMMVASLRIPLSPGISLNDLPHYRPSLGWTSDVWGGQATSSLTIAP